MACKALMCGATTGWLSPDGQWHPGILEQVLVERDPKKAKALGRSIAGFSAERWDELSRQFMFRAVWAKHCQNVPLAQSLVATGERTLVEGSPLDNIWGVGLAWNNPAIEDERKWRGKNWLENILMAVRSLLNALDEEEIPRFNPFLVDVLHFGGWKD